MFDTSLLVTAMFLTWLEYVLVISPIKWALTQRKGEL